MRASDADRDKTSKIGLSLQQISELREALTARAGQMHASTDEMLVNVDLVQRRITQVNSGHRNIMPQLATVAGHLAKPAEAAVVN